MQQISRLVSILVDVKYVFISELYITLEIMDTNLIFVEIVNLILIVI